MKKLKSDKYRSVRGGHSRLFQISCAKCENNILRYQKDGPGPLLRMYMDRIHGPDEFLGLQNLNLKNIPTLKCHQCQQMIAAPYIYKKEKRKAFRVFQGAVKKKIMKTR